MVAFHISVIGHPSYFAGGFYFEPTFYSPQFLSLFASMLFPPMRIQFNDAVIERQSILTDGNKKYMYKVTYEIRKEFTNPNLPNTNKTRTSKFPPTTHSELETAKQTFIDEVRKINGKVFTCKLQPENPGDKRIFTIVPEAYMFGEPIVSPTLQASLYTNEAIAKGNVMAEIKQRSHRLNQITNEVADKIGVSNVAGIIRPFLVGRRRKTRRQTRHKHTRKQRRRYSRK